MGVLRSYAQILRKSKNYYVSDAYLLRDWVVEKLVLRSIMELPDFDL